MTTVTVWQQGEMCGRPSCSTNVIRKPIFDIELNQVDGNIYIHVCVYK